MDEKKTELRENYGLDNLEREKILCKFNNTACEYFKEKTVHCLFEEQVGKSPDTIAVWFKDKALTYAELNQRANQLARRLRKSGVKQNTIVGIMAERSIDVLICILGILKSGGAYLPIDPQYPKSRIEFMLEDSGARILLTDSELNGIVSFKGESLNLDDTRLFEHDISNLDNLNTSCDLIYIIYTSGSTGQPKGVMLEHRNFVNFIKGVTDRIDFSDGKTIVSLTTMSFDIFTLETLLALTKGLSVVLANPMSFSEYVKGHIIDMLQTTPSTMKLILGNKHNIKYIRELKQIMIGGEAFPSKLMEDLKKVTSAKLYNMYGPTETTVWSTIKELTHSDEINIGTPIANTQIYILDKCGNPQPIDIPGEIYVAGDGVGRGYVNNVNLTRERFLDNPFRKGERMYRTGDMAKWLHNGEIIFLGRTDQQVKIRGFRIELGEIEDYLSKLDTVKSCVVAAKCNRLGEAYLVAYYVSDREIAVSELIAYLSSKLPEYMIPGFYLRLDKIPLTPNYKVDRNNLPEPDKKRPILHNEYIGPQTEIEKNMINIWYNILNLDLIGVNDNFFELGGNSILLSILYNEVDRLYPNAIELADIFAYPTVAMLADYINAKKIKREVIKKDIYPLSLPTQYYATDSGNNSDYVRLHYCLDNIEMLNLVNFSDKAGYDLCDVFLALYMYLLHEISGQSCITVSAVTNKFNSELIMNIDFKYIKELSQIIEVISEDIRVAQAGSYINKDMIVKNGIKEIKSIVPGFYYNLTSYSNSLNDINLKLNIQCENDKIEIGFEYNSQMFNKTHINKVFSKYIRLIEVVTNIS